MISFEDYLHSKKIDADAFQKAEPDEFKSWKEVFEQVHPDSFTMQKLNLLNAVRRKYNWKQTPPPPSPLPPVKPKVIRPKIN